MSRTKGLLLLFIAILIMDFAWENWAPGPPLKLLGFDLSMVFPTFLLVYFCLLVGFAVGWVAHALRVKKKQRQAAAASAPAPVEDDPQEAHQAH